MTVAFARGGNPVAIKLALYALSPLQSALTRSMISCLGVSLLSMELHRKLKPKRDEIRPLLLLSLMYSLQIASNQTGADYTSAVYFTILMNTYPITANLVSSLSVPEDRLTVRRICGLAGRSAHGHLPRLPRTLGCSAAARAKERPRSRFRSLARSCSRLR